MKHQLFTFLLIIMGVITGGKTFAQEIKFSKETFSDGTINLQYRKADIPGTGDKALLVIYLHGGSSKGDDNETQMQEPGINSISTWLYNNNSKTIMLVPQCPQNLSWLGTMQDAIVHLLQTYIDRGVADASKVYIFGGSMGGTGTWNMLSNHPELFAAAMPVAGNPTGLNAEAVSKTPLYTVMGTADKLMKISNVEDFLKEMDGYDAEYEFDIEDGWTHEDVCKNSYTDERLAWVFAHAQGEIDDISAVEDAKDHVFSTVWYDLTGNILNGAPQLNAQGIYIKRMVFDNGRMQSEKVIVR